jgi:PAS domain S-box-containing protein
MFDGMSFPAVPEEAPAASPLPTPYAPSGHIVQFYEKDDFLIDRLADFLSEGYRQGEAAVAVATRAHREALMPLLPEEMQADSARFLMLDAEETLEDMKEGDELPDQERFHDFLEDILSRVETGGKPVRLFGEIVAFLWDSGEHDKAIALESLWEREISGRRLRVLCAYPLRSFQGMRHQESFRHICDRHTEVFPSESLASPAMSQAERLRAMAALQQRALDLERQAREMERQLEDLRQLNSMAARLGNLDTLEETLEQLLRHALTVYGAEKGMISLATEDGSGLRPGAKVGFGEDFLRLVEFVPVGKGSCGRSLALGRPVIVEDVDVDPAFEGWREAARSAGFRAVHSVPLLDRAGKVLGVLAAHFPAPYRPSRREVEFAAVYARLAADSLEQARLREETRRQTEQRRQAEEGLREQARALEILNRTAARLASEHDAEAILQAVADGGREIAGAAFGAFLPPALEGRGIVRHDDVTRSPEYLGSGPRRGMPPGHHPVRSYLAVPVVSRTGSVLGGLYFGHPEPARFTRRSEDLIVSLAGQAAVAIDNAKLHASLTEELARRQRSEESARHFAAIVKSSNDAIVSKDLESRVLSWNKAAEAIFGYDEAEMIGRSITVLFPPHLQDEESLILARIRRGESIEHYETVRRRKEGTLINVSLTVSPILDDAGNVVGASKIARDITDRKRIEAALEESEKRFRTMADSAPVFIWMADESGACTYFNRYHTEFSGRTLEEELGDGWFELVHPDDLDRCRREYSAGIGARDSFRLEYRLRRRDGSYRWVIDTASPRFSEQGLFLGFIGCGMDITEHKATEEQLRQSQKMEAVGRLAGGIAHDFNNLLTSINGFTDLALATAPPGSPLKEYLEEVSRSGARAAALTGQLLAYSRKQVLAPKVIDLNAVAAEVERMLSRLIGENLRVITRLYPGLGKVKADPGQVQQILVNLALNARDAMPGGGDVTIETANVILGRDFTATHLDGEPGPYAMLAVRDTGCGMTPEVQARLFEPFFTTKAVGKGTGLGLSSVYGIVKQSGGCISVETAPDRGSVFRIFLPLVAAEAPQSPVAPAKDAGPGCGTLLLAEDEETVRKFLAATLRSKGFKVLEAGDGSQALALAKDRKTLDCLVTDIVMPGLSGSKLAAELRAKRPGLPVLFISGYTRDLLTASELADPGTAFLQKPFSPQELVSRIRELIAAYR